MAAKESVVECNDNPKGNESPTQQPTRNGHHGTLVNRAAAAEESVIECNDNPKGNESPTQQPTGNAHHETPVDRGEAAEEILVRQTKRAADQDPNETSNAQKEQPVTKKKKNSPLTQQELPSIGEPPEGPKHGKYLNRKETDALLIESAEAISKAVSDLGKARALANRAGLSVDSCIIGAFVSILLFR